MQRNQLVFEKDTSLDLNRALVASLKEEIGLRLQGRAGCECGKTPHSIIGQSEAVETVVLAAQMIHSGEEDRELPFPHGQATVTTFKLGDENEEWLDEHSRKKHIQTYVCPTSKKLLVIPGKKAAKKRRVTRSRRGEDPGSFSNPRRCLSVRSVFALVTPEEFDAKRKPDCLSGSAWAKLSR
jgi:hypothetical protein